MIFLTMTAKSEVPVCCLPVLFTFTLLNFDFVLKIEMHSIYNEVMKLYKPRAYNRNLTVY